MVEEILARRVAISKPPPWFRSRVGATGDATVRSREGNRPIARVRIADHDMVGLDEHVEAWDETHAATQADAEFIAHAPADIDWLLNALTECRDALDTAWEEIGALQAVCRDAGLVLYNVPRTDDRDWNWRVNAVLTLIDEILPGGIP